ncbi:MAG: porin [Rhizobacter sp.]
MKRNVLSVAASLALALLALQAQAAPTAAEAELTQKLDKLSAEVEALKTQVAQQASAAAEPATVLTSYGEINYNRPKNGANAQADVRRFVLGYQHRFDSKTKVVTELEVEHGVSSASDPGEVEVEQAYIEHQLFPNTAIRAGLFLMPVGLLNENHEPIAFYGVERNFVETAIIPTTWREGGLQYVGTFDNGLTVQAGLSTGFDLSKWDATSTEGTESPLASIHQEMALAKARDVAVFGAANWRGIPGLLVGGSLFTANATQGQAGFQSARITLWDMHARWTPNRWDLSVLYAQGRISNTAELNAPLVGSTTLIPERFDGGYVQAAYKVWSSGDQSLSPFARVERFNTGKSYADLGPGLTPNALPTERVFTVGATYKLNASVVVKADIQRFKVATDSNRFNLGLGWSF